MHELLSGLQDPKVGLARRLLGSGFRGLGFRVRIQDVSNVSSGCRGATYNLYPGFGVYPAIVVGAR